MWTSPCVGQTCPSIMPIAVLFPAPLWPSSPKISPARTCNVRSSTATRWPKILARRERQITFGLLGLPALRISNRISQIRSFRSLDRQQILNVAIGIEVVDALVPTARAVKRFLVEEHRNLVRIKIHVQHLELLGVLAVEQAVPRIARTGLFVNPFP